MSDEELEATIQQIDSGEKDGVQVLSDLARKGDLLSMEQLARDRLKAKFGPHADNYYNAIEKAVRQAVTTGGVGLLDDSMLPGYRYPRAN